MRDGLFRVAVTRAPEGPRQHHVSHGDPPYALIGYSLEHAGSGHARPNPTVTLRA